MCVRVCVRVYTHIYLSIYLSIFTCIVHSIYLWVTRARCSRPPWPRSYTCMYV